MSVSNVPTTVWRLGTWDETKAQMMMFSCRLPRFVEMSRKVHKQQKKSKIINSLRGFHLAKEVSMSTFF